MAADEADLFFNAFEKTAKQSDESLQALSRMLAAPNKRVIYHDLIRTIWDVYQIPPKDVSPSDIHHALCLLSRKYEGGVGLDPISCNAAGVDLAALTEEIRSLIEHGGQINIGTIPVSSTGQQAGAPARLSTILPGNRREAMPTDFWESLRQGFMYLREECAIDPPLKPAGRLTAIWTAPGSWRLNYWNGEDGAGVTKRFEWHAQSAAARLGCPEEGHAAVSSWLDKVGRDAPKSHVQTITVRVPAGSDQVYSREILDICGLSAEYCRKCAADEMRPRAPHSDMGASESRRTEGAPAPLLNRDAAAGQGQSELADSHDHSDASAPVGTGTDPHEKIVQKGTMADSSSHRR